MGDIQVFRIEDLLSGVRLQINTDAAPRTSVMAQAVVDRRMCSPGRTALDDVCAALSESYQRSRWKPKSDLSMAEHLPHLIFTAMLRAVMVAWEGDPASTLLSRLEYAEALGCAFGVAPPQLEQLLLRAMLRNQDTLAELRAQQEAISSDTFTPILRQHFEQPDGYTAWRAAALLEIRSLIHLQSAMPVYNALLRLEVVGASRLELQKTWQARTFPCLALNTPINSYASVWLAEEGDKASRRVVGRGQRTAVVQNTEDPTWSAALPPIIVRSDTAQLYIVVNHKRAVKETRQAARVDVRDRLVGKAGIKLKGLQPGLSQRLELSIYGGRARGCFAGSGADQDEQDADDELAAAAAAVGEVGAHPVAAGGLAHGSSLRNCNWVVYDPDTGEVAGTANREKHGRVTLQLKLFVERRGGDTTTTQAAHPQTTSSPTSGRLLPQLGTLAGALARMLDERIPELTISALRQIKAASVQILSDVGMLHQGQVVAGHLRLEWADVCQQASSTPEQLAPDVSDINGVFCQVAAALWELWRKQKLQELASMPRPDAWVGFAASSPGDGGGVVSLGSLQRALKHPNVQAHMPFGPGLDVLLLCSKLFRIRAQTVQLVVVQYLLQSWKPSLSYLEALCRLWEPCLQWHSSGLLTEYEVEGLKGLMGLLLVSAIPTLTNHYATLTKKESVPCFLLLLEMLGWALTWDPSRETPIALLSEYIGAAATSRLLRELRPAATNLQHCVAELQVEVECASEDLQRDVEIQKALPGLDDFVGSNAQLRYRGMADHWETLFLYQPGASGAVMSALWGLEEAIKEHHVLLIQHGLASPRTEDSSGGAAPGAGGPTQDCEAYRDLQATRPGGVPSQKGGAYVVELWDVEGAMLAALDRWIAAGVCDLRQQVERLVAAETWQPMSAHIRVASSVVELFRSLQASLEVWLAQVQRGSRRRCNVLGHTILTNVVELVTTYLAAAQLAWDQALQARSLPPPQAQASTDSSGTPRHHQRFGSGSIAGAALTAGSASSTASGKPAPQHRHTPSGPWPSAPSKAGSSMTGLDEMGAALSVEPGVSLSAAMCCVRNSLLHLGEEARDLEATLARLLAGKPVLHWSSSLVQSVDLPGNGRGLGSLQRQQDAAGGGQRRRLPQPPQAPSQLLSILASTTSGLLSSYMVQFRGSIVRLLMSSFGKPHEVTVRMLEGILTAIHDELELMVACLADKALVTEMAEAAWRGAMGALQALVLNQAGFRPLREEEADMGHEFLVSLQDLFGEAVGAAVLPSSTLSSADGRVAGSAYVNSLLQCCTAATADLRDLYLAKQDCLNAALAPSTSGAEAPPTAASLLDLLRLLRQRRRGDALAQQLANEQSKVVAVNALQMIFGLPLNERLVASAVCCLPGTREGSLFLTSHCLCFTTLLDCDLKTTTDTTLMKYLRELVDIRRGDTPDVLLLTSSTGESYRLSGFSSGERNRLLSLLHGETTAPRPAAPHSPAKGVAPDGRSGTPQQSPPRAARGAGAAVGSANGSYRPSVDGAAGSMSDVQQGVATGNDSAGAVPIMSVSCVLYSKIRDKDGTLQLYRDRAEFVPQPPGLRPPLSVNFDDVEHVGTRTALMGNTWLSLQVTGQKDPILFGGMTEGVLSQLKQNMSELMLQM